MALKFEKFDIDRTLSLNIKSVKNFTKINEKMIILIDYF